MSTNRKFLFGRALCPFTDEAIRNLYPTQRGDFSAVVSSPATDAIVWMVTGVTPRTLKLRAYYENTYTEKTHHINGSVFYVLAPQSYFINS